MRAAQGATRRSKMEATHVWNSPRIFFASFLMLLRLGITERVLAFAFLPSQPHPHKPLSHAATLIQENRLRVGRSTLFSREDNGPDFVSSPYDIGDTEDGTILGNADATNTLLAVPESTKIVLGLNKYSHDTSICAADASTGEVLFCLSKERISRLKHDGGAAHTLVQTCLDSLNLTPDNIHRVVLNNHHYRTLPLERDLILYNRAPWQAALGINNADGGLDDELNLLSDVEDKHELSHHLAHAYSVAAQAPFDKGLVVVMDGMGETYRAMADACQNNDAQYTCDMQFQGDYVEFPSDIKERATTSRYDWREAESAYTFEKIEGKISVKPVFKRWIEENTPPVLYNHGFDSMESLGAVYSRASSHIFGDWNACGKVMGLAPWFEHSWSEGKEDVKTLSADKNEKIMSGKLYVEGDFKVNRFVLNNMPLAGTTSYDFDKADAPGEGGIESIDIAAAIQRDLEEVAIDFVQWLKDKTGEDNLCLAGGVALNSVLNGRLSRELGFDRFYIPPYPG
jgi:carbamoyltransferase